MRKPPYPKTGLHFCPQCGAWSQTPWHLRPPHNCQIPPHLIGKPRRVRRNDGEVK